MQTETEIQKLIALLNDPSLVVRLSAMQALVQLGAKDVRRATIVAWYILGEENSTNTRVQKVKQLEGQ